ncbi:MAG: hypothetical protein M3P49_06665, partial [Actinomycetota bacterium]|nr:hypothetical protein [Actinomycetota bacterium]
KEGPYTDLTSEDPIGTEQAGSLYRPDKSGPYTDLAITESTYREDLTDNAESSSESSSESSVFQTGANGFSSRTAPQQKDKFLSQDQEQEQDEALLTTTTSLADQWNVNPKELSEVRRVLEHGKHGSVALKHYRAGSISVEEVAEIVGWEVSHSLEATPALSRAVRRALEEVADESRAS